MRYKTWSFQLQKKYIVYTWRTKDHSNFIFTVKNSNRNK